MRRIFQTSLMAMTILLMGAVITGCSKSSKSTSSTPDNKVVVWADDPNFNVPIMKEAVKSYKNGKNSIDVQEVSDLTTKLNTVLSSGDKDGLPNIVKIEDTNAQKFLQSYPGSFVKLTDDIDEKNFPDYKTIATKYKGDYYGVPFDSGVAGVFYRVDALEKAGYDADALTNISWNQFIDITKNVKEKTGMNAITLSSPVSEDINFQIVLLQSVGTWFFDDKGKIDLSGNKKAIAVYELMKELNDSGLLSGNTDANERTKALQDGSDFCAITGSWFAPTIKSFKGQEGKWRISNVPKMNVNGATNYSNHGGSGWYVLDSGNKKKNKEAINFLKKEFAGDVDFYDTALKENSAVTTYLPAQKTDAWKTEDEFFDNEKVNEYFSNAMKQVPEVNYGVYTKEVTDIFKTYMKDYYSGKISVNELLKSVETDFNNQYQ
jgi:lactose/L-arabinose transport system substrate-binding protein